MSPSWLIERRREAFARFQAFAWPSARDEEWRRTDIRGLQARRLRASRRPRSRVPRPARLFDDALADLELALCHRHRAHQRRPGTPARPGAAGRRGLRRPGPGGQGPSGADRALPADRGGHSRPTDIFAALHAAFWTSGTLLYVPKGVKLESPAVQPDRPGAGGACRPEPHARGARGRGRSHPGPRIGRAGGR